jgi:Raf kinase inhibitor-like YbhB/YbcL family protein
MRTAPLLLAIAAALTGAACGSTQKPAPSAGSRTATAPPPASRTATAPPPPAATASIQVSSDFTPGGAIPRVHTCDGQDTSPPLRATGLPAGTKEVLIVMVDHDAGDFMHWGIASLAPSGPGSIDLPAGGKPAGAVPGRNSFGSLGYRGPCPPSGDSAHHYAITVYALSRPSELKPGFPPGAVTGMPIPALAVGRLTGVYARP